MSDPLTREAQQALEASELRFRAVTQSVNDGIVSADEHGRIVFWNEAAAALFGYEHDEVSDLALTELMPDRYRELHLAGLARLREGGEPRVIGSTVELQGLRRDGAEFPLELSLGSWRHGDLSFYTGIIRDLTECKRSERHLAAQYAVQEVLVESPSVQDAMPRVLAGMGQALGWEAGGFWRPEADRDFLRCQAFWALDPERTSDFEAASREIVLARGIGLPGRVLASAEPEWVPDVTVDPNFPRAAAAERVGLHGAIGLPVLSEGGEVLGVLDFFGSELARPDEALLEMVSTISSQIGQFLRRKQAEEELERSNADLEQFAYVASHDLSEPLRMVSGFVQLLQERYGGRLGSDADEFIGYTVDGVRRMQVLIDDLLAYSRVGRSARRDRVDMSEVVEDARAALAAAIAEHSAEIEVEPMPVVLGDRREFGQVVQNLMSNGIKFVKEGPPHVTVSARRLNGMWEISVRDNGIGIEPRHAERIFKVFQRLHGRDDYAGTGIGLAICKKVVERHGGAISVAPAPGGGSDFRFTLPAAEQGA